MRMSEKKRFIIGNREYYLSKEEVINAFKSKEPKLAKKYYVEINGKKVGTKEAVYSSIDVPKDAFASNSANSILKRLGFEIKKIKEVL